MTDYLDSAHCHHDVPEPVILESRSGRRWCIVRCSACGRRLARRDGPGRRHLVNDRIAR